VTEAPAKINLSLIVGPRRADGKHEVLTVLERVGLTDTVTVERAPGGRSEVVGFPDDTIVRAALESLRDAAGCDTSFLVTIDKRIPLAAGLGGGSSDAAAALRQANALLASPLPDAELLRLGAGLGADVPFFLEDGTRLGSGDGSTLAPLTLPTGYVVVLWLPEGESKRSTADVYAAFDDRGGADGFAARRQALLDALAGVSTVDDLADLPHNDLVTSPLSAELARLGAFRADVTGAGPTLYGLFTDPDEARRAAARLSRRGWAYATTTLEEG